MFVSPNKRNLFCVRQGRRSYGALLWSSTNIEPGRGFVINKPNRHCARQKPECRGLLPTSVIFIGSGNCWACMIRLQKTRSILEAVHPPGHLCTCPQPNICFPGLIQSGFKWITASRSQSIPASSPRSANNAKKNKKRCEEMKTTWTQIKTTSISSKQKQIQKSNEKSSQKTRHLSWPEMKNKLASTSSQTMSIIKEQKS